MTPARPFSDQLEEWLRDGSPKTLGGLGAAFGEKSFTVAIMLLMFVPALPLPTGGVSHVFEVIAALLAAQMVAGRSTIWLPKRWRARPLGAVATGKAIPAVTRWTRRLERLSRRRGVALLERRSAQRAVGLVLMATAVTALLSPPFSGLDTLPGLAAVAICMGTVMGDVVLVGAGLALELGGAVLILTVGAAALHWLQALVS